MSIISIRMFSEQFIKNQDKLYDLYDQVIVIRRIFITGLLFAFGAASSIYESNQDNSVGAFAQICLWLIVLLAVVAHFWLRWLRKRLQARLWNEVSRGKIGKSTDKVTSPLLTYQAYEVWNSVLYHSKYRGLPLTIHRLNTNYTLSNFFKPGAANNYGLEYVVLQVWLDNKFPHIFIDGLSQNIFSFKNTNLWSLPRKLALKQKMQKLEGDFPKYFNVYMAPNKQAPVQVDALSILMPDIMLALRDDGYNFDYEIHNDKLFIICEPDMYTTYDIEAFFKAVDAVLDQLIPQLEKFKISHKTLDLKLSKTRLTINALVNSTKVIIFYLLLIGSPYALGIFLGTKVV